MLPNTKRLNSIRSMYARRVRAVCVCVCEPGHFARGLDENIRSKWIGVKWANEMYTYQLHFGPRPNLNIDAEHWNFFEGNSVPFLILLGSNKSRRHWHEPNILNSMADVRLTDSDRMVWVRWHESKDKYANENCLPSACFNIVIDFNSRSSSRRRTTTDCLSFMMRVYTLQ